MAKIPVGKRITSRDLESSQYPNAFRYVQHPDGSTGILVEDGFQFEETSPGALEGIQAAQSAAGNAAHAAETAQQAATAAAAAAAGAQATADGKIQSYFQDTAPTGASVGDIWFNTGDDNKSYRWNGSTWVYARDSGITQAISAAATAQGTADGKARVYYQNEPPTGLGAADQGDLWVDTNDNNKLWAWNGSTWILAQDWYAANAAAQAAQTAANNAQDAALAANLRQFATISLVNAATGQYDGEIVYCRENCHLYTWSTSGASWSDTSATLPNDPLGYWPMDDTVDVPDAPESTLYRANFSSGVDGWLVNFGCTLSASNGKLVLTSDKSSNTLSTYHPYTDGNGKYLRFRIPFDADIMSVVYYTGEDTHSVVTERVGDYYLCHAFMPQTYTNYQHTVIYISYADIATASNKSVAVDNVYIGDGEYTTPEVDATGNGKDLTLYGAVPVAGVSGKALKFNKAWGKFASGAGVMGVRDFSVTIWVKEDGTAHGWVLSNRGGSYSNGFGFYIQNSTIGGYASNASPDLEIETPGIYMVPNVWHFVRLDILRSTDTMRLSVDNGAPVSVSIASLANAFDSDNLCIGTFAGISSGAISGLSIDEIVIFGRVITNPEAKGLELTKSLPKTYTLARYITDHAADDGYIRPGEKPSILTRWLEIYGNGGTGGTYSQAVTNATTAGVSYTALTTAYNALYAYLYSSPGVLVMAYWPINVPVTTSTYNALWYNYEKELSALAKAVGDAVAAAKAATNAPRYRGIGILAAAATAAFTSATVDTSGVITTGGSVTPNTGDWMINYSNVNGMAVGIYFWTGAIWTSTTDVRYIDSCTTDLFNLNTGGISVSGIATVMTAIIKNLFTQYLKILAGGSIRGGDRYDETGAIVDGTKPGFFIGASGACKVAGIEFEGAQGGGVQWGAPALMSNQTARGDEYASIARLNSNRIVFVDGYHHTLRAYKWTGKQFDLIGNALTISGMNYAKIAALNETDIALLNLSAGTLSTYRFDGTNWALVGGSLSVSSEYGSIGALDATHVAVYGSNSLRSYTWSGAAWSQRSSVATSLISGYSALCALDANRIVLARAMVGSPYSITIQIYEYRSGNFDAIGNGKVISAASTILWMDCSSLNGSDFIFIDPVNDTLCIYRFDGSNISQVSSAGNTGVTSSYSVCCCATSGCDVVVSGYSAATNGFLNLYRFSFALSKPWGYPFTGE